MLRSVFLAVGLVLPTQSQSGLADLSIEGDNVGSAVSTSSFRRVWWDELITDDQRSKLGSLFDDDWFQNQIDEETRIAYAHRAQEMYNFLDSGADSHPDDSYIGFAPLLLRASFHGSGSYTHSAGTGGSNGGTIFNHAELQDDQNGCIDTATSELFALFHGESTVGLADTMVIAGVVALDAMEFPRMDLLKITGGRDLIDNVAHRDRLPSADDDPMDRFTKQYGLSLSQTVALVGGAHNFGAAHGKCTGYQGQWTASPLSWFGPNGSEPTFFPDLIKDDWSWYEVCTFENNTVNYVSIEDPFANGIPDGEEEEGGADITACMISYNIEPVICEEQAMRGCSFDDGLYQTNESPCDVDLLQIRLKSDFFLKANPTMLPFAERFASNPDFLATEFGKAYHKITHVGLERCGLSGHGCESGYHCSSTGDDPLAKTCVLEDEFVFEQQDLSSSSDSLDENTFLILLGLVLGFAVLTFALVSVVLLKMNQKSFALEKKMQETKEVAPTDNDSSSS